MRLTSANGTWVDLRIVDYESPGADPAEDEWDANWLVIEARVSTHEGTSWSSRDPSLTTGEVAELVSWLSHVADAAVPVATPAGGHASTAPPHDDDEPFWWDRLQAAGWLTFTEPNLAFAVAGYGAQAVDLVVDLVVGLGAESAHPPIDPERPGWSPVAVTVTVEQVRAAAAALEEDSGRYPAR